MREASIDRVEVFAYRIPTDFPEADGTLAWNSTTMVLVRAHAGGQEGLGYTYSDAAAVSLIHGKLKSVVEGRDAIDVPGAWQTIRARHAGHLGRLGRFGGAAGQGPPQLKTHFQYPEDDGQFSRAVLRCVGVGKCRHHEGGVMCPSYMATREEEHSTRGRSRALFEMLHGGILKDGWRSDEVREALDLCLACKGCKSDCPVNVDMATYKAEFMAHYYKRRLRPRSAYSMGLIYWWSRLASNAPSLANLVLQAPGLGTAIKAAGGIHPKRSMPRYASQTLRRWLKKRGSRPGNRGPVILFPDTFNNFFRPGVGVAAVEVLERLGYEVRLPGRVLCCGRPLYDEGMLTTAKHLLWQIMSTLGPEVADGTPVVGLEPACVATFRDELVNLFPQDERALRLRGPACSASSWPGTARRCPS